MGVLSISTLVLDFLQTLYIQEYLYYFDCQFKYCHVNPFHICLITINRILSMSKTRDTILNDHKSLLSAHDVVIHIVCCEWRTVHGGRIALLAPLNLLLESLCAGGCVIQVHLHGDLYGQLLRLQETSRVGCKLARDVGWVEHTLRHTVVCKVLRQHPRRRLDGHIRGESHRVSCCRG